MSVSGTELVCPGCGARVDGRGGRERFCPDCHLPLVFDDAPAGGELADVSERRRQARIISWMSTAISTTSTAAKISEPTSVPEFMPGSSRPAR